MKPASSCLRLSKLSIGLLAVLAAAPAFAQSTSAGITGRVADAAGRPVAGAQVVITHVESGTVSRVTTDANGHYTTRGLRVGGPYKVEVTSQAGQDVENGVYLELDKANNVDLQLAAAAAPGGDIDAINVRGTALSAVFTPQSTGAATTISRREIEALPSVRRSLEDYVRMDPRIVQVDKERGGIAAAGQNNRYNNIRIDGVPTNDNFGLNDSGVPALNQPIVVDWIQSFNVSISNYDVTQGDFVGANINAVTKSGTNDFHGAVYGLYRNRDMMGDWINGRTVPAPYRREMTYGAYVGGPILQDRLFFFAGYEKYQRDSEAISNGVAGSGALNQFRMTQAQLDAIIARARQLGATDVGSFAPLNNISNEDSKVLLRLDWNIADGQRAAFRYNRTSGNVLRQNTNNPNLLQADSNRYVDNVKFENWAAMLYSDWSDSFSTEANVSYSRYSSLPTAFSNMPEVSIIVPGGSPTGGTATVTFGKEFSRQSNELRVNTRTAFLAANWYLGSHEVKFGVDYESSDIYNLFLQGTVGSYTFGNTGTGATFRSGLQNFLDGRYTNYTFAQARSGNNADAAARFKIGNVGLFVQDTWKVNDNFTLIYGLRADRSSIDGRPAANPGFLAAYGIDNSNTPDGSWTISPRLGFNYTITSPAGLMRQIRGGVGLFVGSAPGVWLSNSFSNPGVLVNSYSLSASNGAAVPANALASGTPTLPAAVAAQNINAMANDFTQPTVWKANLAIDQQLPWWGLTASAELMVSKVRNGIRYINYGVGAPRGTLPDGRVHFWSNPALGTGATPRAGCLLVNPALAFNRTTNPCRYTNAIVLADTSQGHAENLTLALERPWADNWFAKLAWTIGSSREVNPGTSSTASSNWGNNIVINQNTDELSRSNYEINHRLTFAVSRRFHFFGPNAATKVSMFYEGRNSRPFSYVFGNDANGDGISGNDAFYVPRGPGDVAFTTNTTAADQAAFFAYLDGNADFAARRGAIMQRNFARSPWRNSFDIRIQQDIPLGLGGLRAEVFLDIENFGNLLNKKWGQVQEAAFPYRVFMPNYAGVDAQGRYVLDASGFANRTMDLPYRNIESVWAAQLGFRLVF